MLSIFAHEDAVILAHLDVGSKPTQIPLIQHFLQNSGLMNSIVAVDALHCQEETLKAAKESPNELISQSTQAVERLPKNCMKIHSSLNGCFAIQNLV